jgi:hypothetical protein
MGPLLVWLAGTAFIALFMKWYVKPYSALSYRAMTLMTVTFWTIAFIGVEIIRGWKV